MFFFFLQIDIISIRLLVHTYQTLEGQINKQYGEIENLRTQSIFSRNLRNRLFIGIDGGIIWHKSTYTTNWR
jgi:hypothetical protein